MRRIGVHTSIAGGLRRSLERARELGCNTLQIFSHNPRGWMIRDRDRAECAEFRRLRKEYDIAPVFIHSSYLINLASREGSLRRKSINMILAELHIADAIGADYVILHAGSASGEDPCVARRKAISCLAEVSAEGRWESGILLENTAGERGDIASRVEDLGEIMHAVPGDIIYGVCIDTCHAFSAGYDMRTARSADFMAAQLEKYVGIKNVRLLHVNDSKGDLGSGVDRHEHLGRGNIGLNGLRNILTQSSLCSLPLILETPKKKEDDDGKNLSVVRQLVAN